MKSLGTQKSIKKSSYAIGKAFEQKVVKLLKEKNYYVQVPTRTKWSKKDTFDRFDAEAYSFQTGELVFYQAKKNCKSFMPNIINHIFRFNPRWFIIRLICEKNGKVVIYAERKYKLTKIAERFDNKNSKGI